MTILSTAPKRSRLHDHLLGVSTASVAGLVNVCSVIAFFSFATNVTGHLAVFAEELVNGHMHQISIVAAWLVLFALGAAVSGACVFQSKRQGASRLFGSGPLLAVVVILVGVGFYGSSLYRETLRETEYLVAILLFAMGLQNGLVSSVSKGVVKTTHVTGLLTDLGVEMALIFRSENRQDAELRFKLALHLLIFTFYLSGGIVGGLLFHHIRFGAFYIGGAVLFFVVLYDAVFSHATAVARPSSHQAKDKQRRPRDGARQDDFNGARELSA